MVLTQYRKEKLNGRFTNLGGPSGFGGLGYGIMGQVYGSNTKIFSWIWILILINQFNFSVLYFEILKMYPLIYLFYIEWIFFDIFDYNHF